jgi:hypothetical protein
MRESNFKLIGSTLLETRRLADEFEMGAEGIEPPSAALEADILPLYYAPNKFSS